MSPWQNLKVSAGITKVFVGLSWRSCGRAGHLRELRRDYGGSAIQKTRVILRRSLKNLMVSTVYRRSDSLGGETSIKGLLASWPNWGFAFKTTYAAFAHIDNIIKASFTSMVGEVYQLSYLPISSSSLPFSDMCLIIEPWYTAAKTWSEQAPQLPGPRSLHFKFPTIKELPIFTISPCKQW